MEIQQISIKKIKPYGKNPRKNDAAVEKVANSIREFGFQQPIVVDKDMVVIVGHTRLKAAQSLEMDKVPVVIADNLTDEQARAYRLADNKTNELAEWDLELLNEEIAALEDSFNMDDFGFDMSEFEVDMEFTGETDPDDVPETPEKPVSKLGEIYTLGKHRLMCGDSTDAQQIAKLMDGKKADMVFTDPPYGVSYKGTDFEIIKNDELKNKQLEEFIYQAFNAIKDITDINAAIYVWHASFTQIEFETALKRNGIKVRQQLIWNRGMNLGWADYHWAHEPMFYCQYEKGTLRWFGDRAGKTILREQEQKLDQLKKEQLISILTELKDGSSVWEIKRDNAKSYQHPTQKPVDLAERAIRNSSLPSELVLDLFLGSGSTLIAAEQTGRICYGMELDEHYCDVIRKRWAEYVHGKDCDWKKLTAKKNNKKTS